MFDFEATNAKIAVSGVLTVKLADGTRRRLAIDSAARALQAAVGNEAGFNLDVDLQPGAGAGGAIVNSAEVAGDKFFAVLGMLAAFAGALW